ncbi:MAG TPA: hypothetical protein DCY20_10055, partial [Firmicutes bacterium]|nr:hypothetical protein [Bacillota bacterium]
MSRTKKYLIGFIFLIVGLICFIKASTTPTPDVKIISPNTTVSDLQLEIKQSIEQEYASGNFTLTEPLIIHNPFKNSPLSYLLKFKTEQPTKIQVVVEGKTEHASLSYENDQLAQEHEIQLIGLYPDYRNTVNLVATSEDGTTSSATLEILTNPIENMNFKPTVTSETSHSSELGLYLLNDDYNKYLIDSYGDIRWVQESTSGSLVLLQNGNLLTYNKSYFHYYQVMLQEIDFLGQIFTTYYIPGAGHHSLFETASGDILINSGDKTSEKYIEDMTYTIDRETGAIVSETNIRDYLDITRFEQTLPQYINESYNDWYHLNYAMIDSNDNTLITSGRSQSMVLKIDEQSEELKWIFGPHDEVTPEYQRYLLTPIGDKFSWAFAQHSAKTLPDMDNNPDTTDLILFDNHVDIGVFPREEYTDLNQFSRGVHYRINEKDMTVELLWEFGRELGSSARSTIISEIDYIEASNQMLVLFGFAIHGNLSGGKLYEVNADDSTDITFSMDLLGSGENHIYTAQNVSLDDLNLRSTVETPEVTVLGSEHLNAFKTMITTEQALPDATLHAESVQSVTLADDILTLSAYIPVKSLEDTIILG